MSNDDPGQWMTYAEAGARLGITTGAAKQMARRRGWERRTANAYGVRTAILVPAEVLESAVEPDTNPVGTGYDEPDTNAAAFTLLARQLEREQERADRAERLYEAERQLVEQLRGRLDQQSLALADAAAAEQIAANTAMGLRAELEVRQGWRFRRRLMWAWRGR